MLTRYDPERAPDPKRWLATAEGDRNELALRYHRRAGIRPPNAHLHAVTHGVVETHIALGDETPAAETLQRLMGEGLSRHDAIHAIGLVLVEHIYDIVHDNVDPAIDPNEPYFQKLRELTAESWLQRATPDEGDDDG
jgi:hypothetical protein